MPRKRKHRTHVVAVPPAGSEAAKQQQVPKSIVVKGSAVSPHVAELVMELRNMMRPYTATTLKERKDNRMKDYLEVAGVLGVSHVMAVSQTEKNVILKLSRVPQGPTLHCKVLRYSLMRHVRSLQKRQYESAAAFQTPPLVVLNNFGEASPSHIMLMRVTLQHMFPSINVQTVKLSECRRVVLYHYNKEEDVTELRHYAIRASPVGLSRPIKRLVQARIPDLHDLNDISEYVQGVAGVANAGAASDSEGEDETSHVVLPDKYRGKGNAQAQKSAVKLVELGPRVTLELFKVERGYFQGDVLYHKFVHKTAEEVLSLAERKANELAEKKRRREEQANHVARKRRALEERLHAKRGRAQQRIARKMGGEDDDVDADVDEGPEAEEHEDVDSEET